MDILQRRRAATQQPSNAHDTPAHDTSPHDTSPHDTSGRNTPGRATARRRSRWARVAGTPAVALLAVGLAACGSSTPASPTTSAAPGLSIAPTSQGGSGAPSASTSGSPLPSRAPSGTVTATTTSTAVTTATATVTVSSHSAAATGSTGPGTASATQACTSNHLSASRGDSEGQGGTEYITVLLTNTGQVPCTLTGFPGVSMVKDAGQQLDAAADKLDTASPVVHLAPGGHTGFLVLATQGYVGDSEPGCAPVVHAAGLRIYPPNQRAALFVPMPLLGCAHQEVHLLRTTAVGITHV